MDAPGTIAGANVLQVADLSSAIPTGKTRHVVGGEEVTRFAYLVIARYDNEEGIYLLYCDDQWDAVTDTWHASVEDALHQAEFEYEGVTFIDGPHGLLP